MTPQAEISVEGLIILLSNLPLAMDGNVGDMRLVRPEDVRATIANLRHLQEVEAS